MDYIGADGAKKRETEEARHSTDRDKTHDHAHTQFDSGVWREAERKAGRAVGAEPKDVQQAREKRVALIKSFKTSTGGTTAKRQGAGAKGQIGLAKKGAKASSSVVKSGKKSASSVVKSGKKSASSVVQRSEKSSRAGGKGLGGTTDEELEAEIDEPPASKRRKKN